MFFQSFPDVEFTTERKNYHFTDGLDPLKNLACYLPVDRQFHIFEQSLKFNDQITASFCVDNSKNKLIVKVQHGYGNVFLLSG